MKSCTYPDSSYCGNNKTDFVRWLWLWLALLSVHGQAQLYDHHYHNQNHHQQQQHRKLRWASQGRGLEGEFIVVVKTPTNQPAVHHALLRSPLADAAAPVETSNSHKILDTLDLEYATITRTFLAAFPGSVQGFVVSNLFHPPDWDQILQHQDVLLVEQDQLVEIYGREEQTSPPWGVDRLDQLDANLDDRYAYDYTGKGVRVYVVDTGISTTHQDLVGRVSCGYNALGGTCEDQDGHGTHMAGKWCLSLSLDSECFT